MVKGHFWFKQTSNGNLVGEYCNDHIDRAHTESADVIPGKPQNGFAGEYKSSWHEGSVCSATLYITKPTNSQKYILEWREKIVLSLKARQRLSVNFWLEITRVFNQQKKWIKIDPFFYKGDNYR